MVEPATIGAMLREISVYFDLDGDRHRAIAYDRAAKSVEAANGLHRLLDEGRLEELPGIGPSIARVVGDLARRGSSTVLEKLRQKWPSVIVELRYGRADAVPGLADRARAFAHAVRALGVPGAADDEMLGLLRELRERLLDLARGLRRLGREVLHLGRHDREALARFARARGLDGGVQREQLRLAGDLRNFFRDLRNVRQRVLERSDLAFEIGHAFDQAVDVVQRRVDGLLRRLHQGRGAGADFAHRAGRAGDLVVARQRMRGRFAQRMADGGLVLDARRDFVDVARYVTDFNAEAAGLCGDIADDPLRVPRAQCAPQAQTQAWHSVSPVGWHFLY